MMKKFFGLILAGLVMMQVFLLCSCQRAKEKYTAYSFDYFDTVTTIVGYAESKEEFDRVSGEILAELGEYHRLFTIYNRYEGLENLCTLNASAGETVTLDRRIIDMLLFSKEMYALTRGRVNIAMGSVLSIWHDYRESGMDDPMGAALPPMAALLEAAGHTSIDDVIIDEETCTVTLRDPEMTLDVGAIAKGYAVEMAARMLLERGITGYMLNVGGNVRVIGAKPDGQAWTAGIQDPDPEQTGYLAYLSLAEGSLVTSGSYQRYYTVDGKDYHHIIDPETQMPAEYFTSVSVVCESSAMADALSTALFCMPLSEGQALVASLDGVEAMWLTLEGEKHHSEGFPLA